MQFLSTTSELGCSKMSNRYIRPVSFNLDDPYEVKLNIHANKYESFSVYVKRLIQRDMEGGLVQQDFTQHEVSLAEDDQGYIEGLI